MRKNPRDATGFKSAKNQGCGHHMQQPVDQLSILGTDPGHFKKKDPWWVFFQCRLNSACGLRILASLLSTIHMRSASWHIPREKLRGVRVTRPCITHPEGKERGLWSWRLIEVCTPGAQLKTKSGHLIETTKSWSLVTTNINIGINFRGQKKIYHFFGACVYSKSFLERNEKHRTYCQYYLLLFVCAVICAVYIS